MLWKGLRKFRRDAVLDWNPHADEVTSQLLLGFVPLDEGQQDGATAAVLDLMVKTGFLVENEDGTWSRSFNALLRRLYSTGDRKSNECAAAGLSKSSQQTNVSWTVSPFHVNPGHSPEIMWVGPSATEIERHGVHRGCLCRRWSSWLTTNSRS